MRVTIRRDMNYLEGEKQAWVYCMEEVKEEMHHLRIFSYVLFGVFIVLMAVILVLQGVKNVDTKLMFTLLVSAAAIGGFFLISVSAGYRSVKTLRGKH